MKDIYTESNFELICIKTEHTPMTYGHVLGKVQHITYTCTSKNGIVHGIRTNRDTYQTTNRTEGYASLLYGGGSLGEYALYVFNMDEEEKFKKILDGSIPTYLSHVITEGEHNERKKRMFK